MADGQHNRSKTTNPKAGWNITQWSREGRQNRKERDRDGEEGESQSAWYLQEMQ